MFVLQFVIPLDNDGEQPAQRTFTSVLAARRALDDLLEDYGVEAVELWNLDLPATFGRPAAYVARYEHWEGWDDGESGWAVVHHLGCPRRAHWLS